jgi:6,7-dimethyl-8-ribityllumazine synthase
VSSGGFWPGEPPAGEEEPEHDLAAADGSDRLEGEPGPVVPPQTPAHEPQQGFRAAEPGAPAEVGTPAGFEPPAEPEQPAGLQPPAEHEAPAELEPLAELEPPAEHETPAEQEPAVAPAALVAPEPAPGPGEEPPQTGEPGETAAAHAPGELDVPDDVAVLEGTPSGSGRSVGIVVSRFNGEVTNRMLESALDELDRAGVARDRVTVMPVPGAFELPLGAMALAKTRRFACIVALGCVIRGETAHFDYVAGEAASGLQLAGLETGVPVAFGVLTVDTPEQADARAGRAADAVRSALEMADIFHQLRAQAK